MFGCSSIEIVVLLLLSAGNVKQNSGPAVHMHGVPEGSNDKTAS
jgi:hypothetical protein